MPKREKTCHRLKNCVVSVRVLIKGSGPGTIETIGGTLTAEQLTEFASLQQQFTDISAKLSVWKRLNVLQRLLPNRLKVHSRPWYQR
jgi:hypothetical protein